MRIVINALNVSTGGGLVALRALVPEIAREGSEHAIAIITARSQRDLLKELPTNVERIEVPIDHRNILVRYIVEQIFVPGMLILRHADWLYTSGNQTVLLAPCRVMLLVENANPFSAIRFAWTLGQRVRISLLRRMTIMSIRRADLVRFVSMNSMKLISGRLRIPGRKCVMIPHGAAQRSSVQKPRVVRELDQTSYILTVSNIGPHKNISVLVQAFAALKKLKIFPGKVLIVGDISYKSAYEDLRSDIRKHGLTDLVQFLGWKEGSDLEELYDQATLFVYPSLEETFGMPVLEAMSAGVPVVVPKEPGDTLFLPFEEICGDAAAYYSPYDAESLANVVAELLTDPMRRMALADAGGARSHAYRWDATARTIIHEMESFSRV